MADVLSQLRSQLALLVHKNDKLNERIVALETSVITRVSASEELIRALTPAILEIAGKAHGHLADRISTVESNVAAHVNTTAVLAQTVTALQKAVPVVIQEVAKTVLPVVISETGSASQGSK